MAAVAGGEAGKGRGRAGEELPRVGDEEVADVPGDDHGCRGCWAEVCRMSPKRAGILRSIEASTLIHTFARALRAPQMCGT
eukprot:361106-Chlamydomonas_euryale.AAC.4